MVFGTLILLIAVTTDIYWKTHSKGTVESVLSSVSPSVESHVGSVILKAEPLVVDGLASTMQAGIENIAPGELQNVVGEQERLDAILKAFHRLPAPELERLQVDIEQPVTPGTPQAQALFDAWTVRQAELKAAMKNLLQPAEHMGNLTRVLNGTAPGSDPSRPLSQDEQVYLLKELEALLDDVDNARDFHTIGGWPTLLSFLTESHPPAVRATAAWAVGTAVKNTYDYQLWTLEALSEVSGVSAEGAAPTGVQLLLSALEASVESGDTELQKRSLYALSAAMRGNVDVQDAVRQVRGPTGEASYLTSLWRLARVNSDNDQGAAVAADVQRKVWASLADLLQERAFIRRELANEAEVQRAQQAQGQSSQSTEGNATAEAAGTAAGGVDVEGAVRAVQEMPLLGDALVAEQWVARAVDAGAAFSKALLGTESEGAQGVALHAALRSVLAFCREALVDSPQLFTPEGTGEGDDWRRALLVLVRTVSTDFERASGVYDALIASGEELAALLGLWDQGANAAVF